MNKIYTLGPQFSYSYNLCAKVFSEKEIVCTHRIEDVFDQVMSDEDCVGVVPIENMISGSVRESLLALKKYSVCIDQSYDFCIRHVLASKNNTYKTIMSHAQPLAQCSAYIHSEKIDTMEVSSTSEAMRRAADDDTVAAIGSVEAAEYYGVPVIQENISDRAHNITRFIVMRSSEKKCSQNGERTSMIITPNEDRSGLLFEILSVFKIKQINLTRIESIPTGNKMNDYIFYIDINGALKEGYVQDAISFLRTFVTVDVFGSYCIEDI